MIRDFIQRLHSEPYFQGQWVHHEVIPARKTRYADPSVPLPDHLVDALSSLGIRGLYLHQAAAWDRVARGENVAVATATASGKSLTYHLPVFSTALEDPDTRALYLFPLKALGQDQRKAVAELSALLPKGKRVRAAIYDGDTAAHRRRKIRQDPPHILITNPDMLHLGLLPYHDQWEDFWRTLRFVVMDELHTYRGIFGSHIVQVMRRLRRVCRHYGSEPGFIACSATIENPGELAHRLTGLPFTVVDDNGAPEAGRHFLFLNPALSPHTAAVRLFRMSIKAGLKTIVFTRARKITELIHTWAMAEEPDLRRRISSYRAGFLPEERREIESRLSSGELDGVISTSALEMGIDIGGLDVCILAGYPGTVTTTWQRGGRVGRSDRESLIILIAGPDALDQYFMRYPLDFFDRSFEAAVVDPYNREVLRAHLPCAAAELPLRSDEQEFEIQRCADALDACARDGTLLQDADGHRWICTRHRPHRNVNIRTVGEAFTIFEEGTKKVVGSVNIPRVFTECHPGAVYLHRAAQYRITHLDLKNHDIWCRHTTDRYYTRALSEKETEVLDVIRSRPVANFVLRQGRLKVTERVVGFEKRRISGGELLSTHTLELPPNVFETVGIWMEIETSMQQMTLKRNHHFMGAIHALEHAAISIFPLFAMCDRDDVGGISYPHHPQVGKGAIFIYDGYPGGVGLAERAFDVYERLLEAALKLISQCSCEVGCPSCIHSPKCGSGNKPLDKAGAQFVLDALLGKVPLEAPGPPHEEKVRAGCPEEKEQSEPPPPKAVFIDLETQRSAEEVGGWSHAHLMGLALAVTYEAHISTNAQGGGEDGEPQWCNGKFRTYFESDVDELLEVLQGADLVVGFNVIRFDYDVLRGYTHFDFSKLRTLDILQDVYRRLGYRLSLEHLSRTTLGVEKEADGLQSLQWFKEGRLDLIEQYCRKDVEITRDLFRFGLANGYLLFRKKDGKVLRLPMEWDILGLLRV
ncbi:MAG: DUF1998 domain-containing protein [Deltaproteobacteria bacterium]|nr:DUF1998 domain-containing protein [Deltaproteobacteria bacterium]